MLPAESRWEGDRYFAVCLKFFTILEKRQKHFQEEEIDFKK